MKTKLYFCSDQKKNCTFATLQLTQETNNVQTLHEMDNSNIVKSNKINGASACIQKKKCLHSKLILEHYKLRASFRIGSIQIFSLSSFVIHI